MKKTIIIVSAFALVSAITLAAFNSEKGEPKSKEGIIELSANDSLVQHGKELVNKAKYSNVDLETLKLYFNKK